MPLEEKLIEAVVTTLGPGAGVALGLWLYARKTPERRPDVVDELFSKIDRLQNDIATLRSDVAVLKDRWDRMQ